MPEHIEDDPPSEHVAGHTDDGALVLAQMKRLEGAVVNLAKAFETPNRFAKRTRNIALATGVAAVLALSGAGIAMVAQQGADDAKRQADIAAAVAQVVQAYQVDQCAKGNELRAADKAFWTDIFRVIAPPDASPGAKAFVAKLKPKVDKRYAPRDCAGVKDGQVR